MKFKKAPLGLAITIIAGSGSLLFSSGSFAQTGSTTQSPVPVTEIRVTALGIDESADLIVAPFDVLGRDELLNRAGTLGDLLNGLTGVHADSFGGGASRPVIRGQGAPRTKILSDGNSILDASDVSPDHAVTVDPLLAQRIEVLRGPATLLYGGGAIGGVVNVVDDKIPTSMPEKGYEGFAALRGNTVADEKAGAISLTGRATDNIALHFETSLRDTDDYQAAEWDEPRVDGTFSENKNSSLGASWIGEKGFIGLAYSYRADEYGIPGHSEEYLECHPHGIELHCGSHDEEDDHDHDHDHDHEEHAVPFVDLTSKRVDLRGEIEDPFAGINKVRFRASTTNYEHTEFEEDEVGATFGNKGYEARLEVDHAAVMGWQGLFGIQVSDSTFKNGGEHVFMPTVDSKATGIFIVEHYQLNDDWHFEAGARYDRQKHQPVNDARNRPAFSDSAFSYSTAAIWNVSADTILSVTYAHAQRLPHAQELYSRGVHVASNTYECGLIAHPLTCGGVANNQDIQKETADNFELGLRKVEGAFTYSFSLFRNKVDDYIYARTLDQYEDFRLIKYTQRDAEFTGYEVELGYSFNDVLSASLFSDYVRVGLSSDDRLPRIPPRRTGGRINAEIANGYSAELEFYRAAKPSRVANFETIQPAYDMLNLSANYAFGDAGRYQLFLRGSNLLDEDVRNHSSFLADVVPMPGRNLSAGFKLGF
ncbi:MAG: TonB-dependent receptor [Pseudohongiella sp.]|nr:TonB-dependent receptor [Pseudohongiella sp.]